MKRKKSDPLENWLLFSKKSKAKRCRTTNQYLYSLPINSLTTKTSEITTLANSETFRLNNFYMYTYFAIAVNSKIKTSWKMFCIHWIFCARQCCLLSVYLSLSLSAMIFFSLLIRTFSDDHFARTHRLCFLFAIRDVTSQQTGGGVSTYSKHFDSLYIDVR